VVHLHTSRLVYPRHGSIGIGDLCTRKRNRTDCAGLTSRATPDERVAHCLLEDPARDALDDLSLEY
jgi:hypothetical protein